MRTDDRPVVSEAEMAGQPGPRCTACPYLRSLVADDPAPELCPAQRSGVRAPRVELPATQGRRPRRQWTADRDAEIAARKLGAGDAELIDAPQHLGTAESISNVAPIERLPQRLAQNALLSILVEGVKAYDHTRGPLRSSRVPEPRTA
ncbi:hypothetical protein ACFYZI_36785 [Streptomyces griseorubiginosus]|uniref:hypothetical protein n=1 Tax=Streptomyces griseorubiginosus TaxID=67304 RepID=UPI000AB86F61|nr:hypothetical protein [Streptomyces griseorubiginosus]